ncbi:MAG: M48 family metalloprotease, partial [Phycisphaerales bacterium]
LGVELPFSRSHEREADRLGLLIAAEAGYDPRAAISLWTRMAAQGGGGLEFLSTHPLPESRVEELQALIPEAEAVRQAAAVRAPRP